MIKELLTKGEHVELNIHDSVFVTNKRIIEYDENNSNTYFKDLSLEFLESIKYESVSNPWYRWIGIIGSGLMTYISFKIQEINIAFLGLIWLSLWFFAYYRNQKEELVFYGNNTHINCFADIDTAKQVREIYNKYNK